MGISTITGNKFLDHILSTASWTMPGAIYVSLHTADPGLSGSNEVVGGGYGRQGDTAFSAASGLTASNTGALTFTNMPTCTISHVGIWTLVTGGEFLGSGPLSSIRSLISGDTFIIQSGDLDVVAN